MLFIISSINMNGQNKHIFIKEETILFLNFVEIV